MDASAQLSQTPENTYHVIRASLVQAQQKLTSAVNSAMVTAYWEIGREIFRACGENDRAEYGKRLLHYLSERLTAEFGKGFDETNLRKMRQFYFIYSTFHFSTFKHFHHPYVLYLRKWKKPSKSWTFSTV